MENNTENYSQYCFVVGATDVGKKRAANEDYLGKADTPNGRVVVVCDGMGGHVGGATASHIAVETILNFLRENFRNDPREAIGEAIDAANQAILNHARTHPELTGMGSTCVLLIVRNGKVYIGHVGDSRIYLVRSKTIRQLTVDHSFVQELVDAGAITKDEAEHHPRKNEITNALGIPNMKPATVREEPISPEAGDVFLLCSDGLSNMVDDKHIAHIASNFEMTTQQRANTLVQRANDNGGLDNITCALVEFSAKPGILGNVPFWKKRPFIIGAVAATVLILGIAAWTLLKHHTTPDPEPTPTEDSIKPVEVKVMELRKETVNVGEININADQKELLTIHFESFYTQIYDSEGKAITMGNTTFPKLNPDSVKCKESIFMQWISPDKKIVELKLTEKASELKKELNNGKNELHFSMQDDKTLYMISFKVRIKENETIRRNGNHDNQSGDNSDAQSSTSPKENPNDTTFIINVTKDNFKIALYSSQPDENDLDGIDDKKKVNFAIDKLLSPQQDWFSVIRNDGNLCVIGLKRNKIPTGASIELGLKNVEGKITLRLLR